MSKKIVSAISAMLFAAPVTAHEGMGPHGGRLADLPKHHLELIVRADTIEVFVSDKASVPIPANGLTGLAIVVIGDASARISLVGEGGKLLGKAASKLPDRARSVVQIKLNDGQTIQASFD